MRNPVHVVRLFASLAHLTIDLRRLDRVIEINDLLMKLRTPADTRAIVEDFQRSPEAAKALACRRRLSAIDIPSLVSLPSSTLGGAYGRFMLQRGLKPESLPEVDARTDMHYILAHIYETHDLWHVVTGFDTNPAGEAGLQAFYLAQLRTHLPFFALSAILVNTAIFAYDQKEVRLHAVSEGWRLGKRAKCLAGIDWRQLMVRPLAEVRSGFGLDRDGYARGAA